MAGNSNLRIEVLLQAADKLSAPLKRMAAGSRGLSDELAATTAQLGKLKAQQSALKSFHTATANMRATRAELAAARGEYARLASQTNISADAQKSHAQQMAAAAAMVQKLSGQFDRQANAARRAREQMAARGVSDPATAQARIGAEVDKTTAKLATQQARYDKLRAAAQKHAAAMAHGAMIVGTGMAAQHAGRKAVDVGLKPVGAFMQHEDAMLGVARQVQGARGDDGQLTQVYRDIEAQVREISTRLPQTTVQIAEMTTAAARMEVPTEELGTFVQLASEMATAFDAVPDEIAESMGKVAKNFKRPVTEIRGLADAINYLDDNAISKGADIIDVLNRTSGVASTVAISAENTAALGSTLLTLGERAETAGTAINAIFTKFAAATKGTKKFQAAVKEIGMTPAQIQDGMATDAAGTLQKVAAAVAKLPKKAQMGVMADLVGMEHSDTLAKLVQQPEELARQMQLANGPEGKGSMAKEAAARNSTLSAQTMMQQNRLFNSMAIAGETLKTPLLEVYQTLNPLLEKITAWMQANPAIVGGVLKLVIGAGLLATALGALLVPIGLMLAKSFLLRLLFGRLALGFSGVGTAVRVVGGAFTAGGQWLGAFMARMGLLTPAVLRFGGVFLRLLGPIGLVITAATLLYQNWDGVVGGAKLLWADFVESVGNGVQGIMALASRFYEAGANIIQGLVNGITSRIAAVRDAISSVAGASIDWFKEKLGIHSPSRVFAELGGYVSEGAAEGIAGGSGMVRNAALGMAAAAMVPMGATAGPAGQASAMAMVPMVAAAPMAAPAAGMASSNTYNIAITINGSASGNDVEAAVRRAIDNIERQRGARQRSTLADID
ncbi:phage tail tape measure protein [Comamonas sp. J-3]|uniref:phage tail tape measure protein n=1 Tax=Comamonas trifloxystrobinivorans TaxID=3350256 RepID=UPI00372B64D3